MEASSASAPERRNLMSEGASLIVIILEESSHIVLPWQLAGSLLSTVHMLPYKIYYICFQKREKVNFQTHVTELIVKNIIVKD